MPTAQATATNKGKYLLLHQTPALDLDSTTFVVGLLKATSPTPTQIKTIDFISDMVAIAAEATTTGYSRKTSSGGADFTLSVTEDDTNGLAAVTINTNLTWTLSTGDTIYAAFIAVDRGGADTANEVVGVVELAAGIPTNGGTFTLQFPTVSGHALTVLTLS